MRLNFSKIQKTASALPNIRIQVNNDNLKNAPYLLEAAARPNGLASVQPQQQQQQHQQPPTAPSKALEANGPTAACDEDTYRVVKEETIEEILDLEPESVIKLAPQNLILSAGQHLAASGHPQQPHQWVAPDSEPASLAQDSATGGSITQTGASRKPAPSLPVANSHLKKPAANSIDRELAQPPSPPAAASSSPSAVTTAAGGAAAASGAKSLVVHAIALEPTPASSSGSPKNKPGGGGGPPDVWEPSQVMSGNASQVPAIVHRDYGSHTRTRVTLGGGYQRDREPVSPAAAAVEEREALSRQLDSQATQANLPSKQVSAGGGGKNLSHLIDAPERIVLPASIFPEKQQSNSKPAGVIFVAASTVTDPSLLPPTPPPGRKQKLDSRCPKQGVTTFGHASECDKYFYCEDGYLSEQRCPNGLLYGTRETVLDYCVHRWKATCDDRSIPNPISSPGCRWQYGIFSVQGSPKCTPDYYECTEGRFEVRKCAIDGQVYDDRTKSCHFSEAVGCAQEALGDFQCPPDDQANTYWPFPRYFLNERALIHCVNDKPEIVRCTPEERVDPEHLHCVPMGKLQAKSAQLQASGSHNAPQLAASPAERRARERKKDNNNNSSS